MIRILLIEELAVVRESLAMALATAADMELQCCSSIEEGIDLLKGSAGLFDVVLLKPSAGGRKADELLSITNGNGLKGRVLVITPGLGDREQRWLTGLGVAGIFSKQRSLVDLIGAIRDLACDTTSEVVAEQDRCRPTTSQTPRDSTLSSLARRPPSASEIGPPQVFSRTPIGRSYPRKEPSADCVARWRIRTGGRSRGRTTVDRAPDHTGH